MLRFARNTRRFLFAALLLAAVPALPLPAAAAAAATHDELVIGISQYPAALNPNTESSIAQSYVLNMAYRPFTTYDKDWKLVCMLCTELPSADKGTLTLETRPDGTQGMAATFTIQPKATWGDGTPVTTRDALFTWQAGRHEKAGFTAFEMFSRDIIDITVADDKTFTLHFRPELLCQVEEINDFQLLPAHLERAVFEADPAEYGNRSRYVTDPTNPGLYFGPYRITQVENGSHIVLEPNPTWWGTPPHFKRIVVKAIENTAALEANLLSGAIDAIAGEMGVTLDQALAFEKRHGSRYTMIYKPGLLYEHIDLNLDNPILADLRVRQALLLALDRQTMAAKLFAGKQPVADANVHPLDAVYSDAITRYPFDAKRAARLLDEAGWSDIRKGVRHNAAGQPLTVEIATTAGNRSREMVEQVLQSQWRQVGIDVRIANQPARVLFGETLKQRRFTGMALFSWSSAPESVPRASLHSNQIPVDGNGWAGQNYPGFRDAEADRVLDDLQKVCAGEPRRRLWNRIQQIYTEKLPVLPLFFRADAYILPTWLEGVEPTGHQYGSTLWVENWRATR